jgi:hypothetical protein
MKRIITIVLFNVVGAWVDNRSHQIRRLLSDDIPLANSQLRRYAAMEREETFEANISSYSIKFEQCQSFTTGSNIDSTDNSNSTSIDTAVNQLFVLFRLCPLDKCTTCLDNYAEYVIDVKSYLESTTEYVKADHDAICKTCRKSCDQNVFDEGQELSTAAVTSSVDQHNRRRLGKNKFYNLVANCSVCLDECKRVDDLEMNGYMDASNYLQCTKIYENDKDGQTLYAGPICTNYGTKIEIGVYTDDECNNLDETKLVDDYIYNNGTYMKMDYTFLKPTYEKTCISCEEPKEQNENMLYTEEDADSVTEMCEELYNNAKNCETHIYDGYTKRNENTTQVMKVQIEVRDDVCTYFASFTESSSSNNIETTNAPTTSTPTIVPATNIAATIAPSNATRTIKNPIKSIYVPSITVQISSAYCKYNSIWQNILSWMMMIVIIRMILQMIDI